MHTLRTEGALCAEWLLSHLQTDRSVIVCYAFWLTLLISVALTRVIKWLDSSGSYGKLSLSSSNVKLKSSNPISRVWFNTSMYATHSRAFVVYYATSLVCNASCIAFMAHTLETHPEPHRRLPALVNRLLTRREHASLIHEPLLQAICALSLFSLHTARRLYESIFVASHSSKSGARQHHIVTVLGSLYYVMIPLTLMSEALHSAHPSYDAHKSWLTNVTNSMFSFAKTDSLSLFASYSLIVRFAIGLLLFVYGNVKQHQLHVLLRCLRDALYTSALTRFLPVLQPSTSRSIRLSGSHYALPHDDWFRFAWCAHYTAELVLYAGMYILLTCSRMHTVPIGWTLVCLVAVENLTMTAGKTRQWYRDLAQANSKSIKSQELQNEIHHKAAIMPMIY